MKEGSTSRYLASCVMRKNLCPGITVRLDTPLLYSMFVFSDYNDRTFSAHGS